VFWVGLALGVVIGVLLAVGVGFAAASFVDAGSKDM